ncbi:hypothetical protein EBAPG3_005735 [Nitrosospira lacus]|uniref:Uncharacterized protein n=1 Tax=Nitrosospira lacus TaxID=1288494 RepID=A0A1W6SNE9_9PROT|nr:hypothetical protein [Nitrosospira lacus]ARO87311.1 hypothetical protein EBAPG3_005735 [Nitrosospira lacus]
MTVIYLEDVKRARAEIEAANNVTAVKEVEDGWKIETKTIKKFIPGFLYEGVEQVVRHLCRNNNK